MKPVNKYLLPLDEYDEEELVLSDDLWRPCPSWPGYDASYKGWVRSWIMPGHTKNGYYYEAHRFKVYLDGKPINKTRGQLVADAFLSQPEKGWTLRYLDGDNRNYAATNLTWEPKEKRTQPTTGGGKYTRKPPKTHCKWGHPLSDDKIQITSSGERMCLVCARAHVSRLGYRKRLEARGESTAHLTHEFILKLRGDWVEPES